MILYCYECPHCGQGFEAYNNITTRCYQECPVCGKLSNLVIRPSNPRDWFRPHWNEHLDPDKSIYVKTRSHYKDLCKQYGVYARCL